MNPVNLLSTKLSLPQLGQTPGATFLLLGSTLPMVEPQSAQTLSNERGLGSSGNFNGFKGLMGSNSLIGFS